MTAAKILKLNGDMSHDAPMMEVVRRFHAVSSSRGLPYCVVGGMAVVRNGYARTTVDVDILTYKSDWVRLLPLQGEISSQGIDSCLDTETGIRIDILFADEDWGMAMPMPDPRKVMEFDEELGANFIDLHALVQLKAAVYLAKLHEQGEDVASKDRSDVFELMRRNLSRFTKEIIQGYHPAVRGHCRKAFKSALRAARRNEGQGKELER